MSTNQLYKDTEVRMKKSIEHLQHELAKVRTGRATPALLDVVKVDYYGSTMPINQVSTVTASEPRLLVVQPWEKRMIPEIEKAILSADLGLNPSNDGNVVRVPIPELSEDRRLDLIKLVKKFCEETKIAIRNIRRDANDHLKKMEKDHDISEDESHAKMDEVQKLTDDCTGQVDDLLTKKEKEILED